MNRSSWVALVGSAFAHAAVLSLWSTPTPLTPAELHFSSDLDAVILEAFSDAGDTSIQSIATAESLSGASDDASQLEVKRLTEITEQLNAKLQKEIEQRSSDQARYEQVAADYESEKIAAQSARAELESEQSKAAALATQLADTRFMLEEARKGSDLREALARDRLQLSTRRIEALQRTLTDTRNQSDQLLAQNQKWADDFQALSTTASLAASQNRMLQQAASEQAAAFAEIKAQNDSLHVELEQLKHELLQLETKTASLPQAQDAPATSEVQPSTGNALSDRQPMPVAGNPKPTYPRLAIKQGLEGNVSLHVSISELGRVAHIAILRPSGSKILDEAAIQSVQQWQFTPAYRDGQPTATVTTIPIEFRLIDARG
ncbi:MAG: TonB family protein [Gammaproteobacteria bacterium]